MWSFKNDLSGILEFRFLVSILCNFLLTFFFISSVVVNFFSHFTVRADLSIIHSVAFIFLVPFVCSKLWSNFCCGKIKDDESLYCVSLVGRFSLPVFYSSAFSSLYFFSYPMGYLVTQIRRKRLRPAVTNNPFISQNSFFFFCHDSFFFYFTLVLFHPLIFSRSVFNLSFLIHILPRMTYTVVGRK